MNLDLYKMEPNRWQAVVCESATRGSLSGLLTLLCSPDTQFHLILKTSDFTGVAYVINLFY